MKFLRKLCYRAKLFDGKVIDNAIDLHTAIWNPAGWKYPKLRCSHREIWLPDEGGHYQWKSDDTPEIIHFGTCYTSTMGQARDKKAKYNGVCNRQADEVLTHPDRWFYAEYEVPEGALNHALTWADLEIANNRGYDVWDIAKYFLPVRRQNLKDHRLICSGFDWAFTFKLAMRWAAEDKPGFLKSPICKLVRKRLVNDLPSPFRETLWEYTVGVRFFDLVTGKEIYERN